MTTSHEYRQFARECAKWAAETKTDETRSAFLDLACDWTFAAHALDRLEKRETCRMQAGAVGAAVGVEANRHPY
jgi:hypothetical protein